MSDVEGHPMRTPILAITTLFLLAGASTGSGQRSQQCLHDQLETSANRARREKALEWAHKINQAETKSQGSFLPFDRLFNVPPAPDGFKLQFHVDGETYAFSIKDMRDPCAYAIFSDQSGNVYEGTPAPLTPRVRLLSQR
jgi:hypothetical protein